MSTHPTSKSTSAEDIDSDTSKDISVEEEYPYEETVLASDLGTVTFRDCGNGEVWLGLRRGNDPHSLPEVSVQLTQRQQVTLSSLFIECRRQNAKAPPSR